MNLKFGSIFAGIGGFDLGFERAGMQCAWQIEVEVHCSKLLEDKFPNAKRYADVREIRN
jgi:DNA (cytosine-5)-methyltransferase 1